MRNLQKVKEHHQKNEEMQKKGRIKMTKSKNKDINTLQRIFAVLEDNLRHWKINYQTTNRFFKIMHTKIIHSKDKQRNDLYG